MEAPMDRTVSWELVRIQEQLLEQAKEITRILEAGRLPEVTHHGVGHSLEMLRERWEHIPFIPRPPRAPDAIPAKPL